MWSLQLSFKAYTLADLQELATRLEACSSLQELEVWVYLERDADDQEYVRALGDVLRKTSTCQVLTLRGGFSVGLQHS